MKERREFEVVERLMKDGKSLMGRDGGVKPSTRFARARRDSNYLQVAYDKYGRIFVESQCGTISL